MDQPGQNRTTPIIPSTTTTAATETTAVRPRRRWLFAGIAATVIGTLAAAGIAGAADGWHHGGMDPDHAVRHVDRLLEHMVPDATADQKARIEAIAKAATTDLQPLREKHRAAREQGLALLSARSIDRAALEQVRRNEMDLAQQVSQRMTQAMADAAEVLTPDQRTRLATRIQERMRHHGGNQPDHHPGNPGK